MSDDEAFLAEALAYLDDALEPAALERFGAQLGEPEARALVRLLAHGERLGQLAGASAPAAPAPSRRRGWLTAAALLLAVAAGLLAWRRPAPPIQLRADVVVRPLGDARWEVVAPDRVRLLAGELDVDCRGTSPSSPFHLETPGGLIRAAQAMTLVSVQPADNGDSRMSMPITRALVIAGLITLSNPHGAIDGRAGQLLAGEPEAAPREVVQGTTAFGLELFRRLAASEPGNLTLSPYSVHACLALAHEGARGETRAELAAALRVPARGDGQPPHLRWAAARLRASLTTLRRELTASDGVTLDVANRAYVDKGFPLRPEISRALAGHEAAVVPADFRGDPAGSRAAINAWVARQTRDHIQGLLGDADVNPTTRLLLINALYLQARWKTPFEPTKTTMSRFRTADGAWVRVPIMERKQRDLSCAVWTERGGRWKLADLPYRGDRLVMSVIVPPHGQLPGLLSELTPARLKAMLDRARPQHAQLELPRFAVSSSLALRPALEAMGIRRAFAEDADLTGFSAESRGLRLAGAAHRAVIKVGEKGTEAAAATFTPLSEDGELDAFIDATRPFLYLIRDTQTGQILFIGRVDDPSAD